MKNAAVFLDRDGTLIEDVGYICDPGLVRLLDGAADAVRRWNQAGWPVVVVSNQSGVARGLILEAQLEAVTQRMVSLLSDQGATLQKIYYCPYLDGEDARIERYRKDSELRKPRPGMLLQAAKDLGLDLRRSWMIGDEPRDVEAGKNAGCRTILLQAHGTHRGGAVPDHIVGHLLEAAVLTLEDV